MGNIATNAKRVSDYEVVVIGHGMAGLNTGIRAAECGASTVVLEKAPKGRRGGHTRFSERLRVASTDLDISAYGYEFEVDDYSKDDFYEDIMDQTDNLADEELVKTLVDRTGETVEWMTAIGVEWDTTKLTRHIAPRVAHGGQKLIDTLSAIAAENGVDIWYDSEARELTRGSDNGIDSAVAITDEGPIAFECDAVVLASGDYGSNEEKRTKYIGPGFDEMIVRGSRYNTGEAIDMAIEYGAKPIGQWSNGHMCVIDTTTPEFDGGVTRVEGYQYGAIVNHEGERFVDEGEGARSYTYAKFGRRVFEQPHHEAFVIADAKTEEHVFSYGDSEATEADSLKSLARGMNIENVEQTVETIEAFNAACDPEEFDPEFLDGNATEGIAPPKSNWAIPIDEPPFRGFPITGGMTFTFGGIEINPKAEVISTQDRPIPGLYAAGVCTGGIWYNNYAGSSAQTQAAVYGKLAGEQAAAFVAGESETTYDR